MRAETTWAQGKLLRMVLVMLSAHSVFAEGVAAQESPPYPGCEMLGTSLEQHACFHAAIGPFITVAGNQTANPPNVNAVHTHYTVQLGVGGGEVSYRPARDGSWSLFSSTPLPITVLDSDGIEVTAQLSVESVHCAQLQRVQVYSLAANVRYRVVLGSTEQSSVGLVFERLADFESTYYPDADADGFGGVDGALRTACVPPAGLTAEGGDCNDGDGLVSPLAIEVADGRDNDCDGLIDEGMGGEPTQFYYLDQDGDGFGDQESAFEAVSAPPGYMGTGGDCNDVRADIHPGVTEVCDNQDNDCDGEFDEGFPQQPEGEVTRYLDYDGDGHGSPGWPIVGCGAAAVGPLTDDDCDDVSPSLNPSAAELCDGADNDCDELVDRTRDGTDVCRLCDPIRLHARWNRRLHGQLSAHVVLTGPVRIRVPRAIAITRGCALGKLARLSLSAGGRATQCHYLGVGPEYRLIRCSSGVRAENEVTVQELRLHVSGSGFCGPTRADLTLAPVSCGAPTGN